jgi:transposase
MTYSLDFREKILLLKKRESLGFEEAAERFGVGKASMFRWSKRIEAWRTRNKSGTKINRRH